MRTGNEIGKLKSPNKSKIAGEGTGLVINSDSIISSVEMADTNAVITTVLTRLSLISPVHGFLRSPNLKVKHVFIPREVQPGLLYETCVSLC